MSNGMQAEVSRWRITAAAVMLSVDDLASLEESWEIMARPRLVAQIRDSFALERLHSARRGNFRSIYRAFDAVTISAIEHRADV